jgi:hypothetical protein
VEVGSGCNEEQTTRLVMSGPAAEELERGS